MIILFQSGFFFRVGEKAVKPFLTESVRDIYAKEKIDVPIVFGFTNGVS